MHKALVTLFCAAFGLGLAAAPPPTGSWEKDPACAHLDSTSVRRMSDSWAAAITAGDIEAVTQLYSKDAILMGLQEPAVRIGQTEIAEHYSRLLPGKLSFRTESRVIENECSPVLETGVYAVTLGVQSAALTAPPVKIRYTVMYGFTGDVWRIIHHHMELEPNQIMPEPVPTGPIVTRWSTGSITPRTNDITLPAAPFAVPQSPPVIILPTLRLLLSTSRPEPAAAPDLVTSPPAPSVAAIDAPPAQFTVGSRPPEIAVAPEIGVAKVEFDNVEVPRSFAMGVWPRAAPDVSAPLAVVAAPRETLAISAKALAALAETTAKIARLTQGPLPLQSNPTPAVAGYVKRAPSDHIPATVATKRPVGAALLAKPAPLGGPTRNPTKTKNKAQVPVPPEASSSDYKPGRWVDDRPVFGE